MTDEQEVPVEAPAEAAPETEGAPAPEEVEVI